jgi:guanosine-3',5'-bis(diphosphate) 3'-pyrophosphohydrolase
VQLVATFVAGLEVYMLPPPSDAAVLLDALHFASAKHRDQRRQDVAGSPFVNHPIETAWLLACVGGVRDRTMLVSAILHDILEDTLTTAADLEGRFGVAVRRLVEELTDEAGLPTDVRRQRQLARVARASCAAKQIRLADKIANLRSLSVQWSRAECEQYLDFAERVAAAVAGANAHLDGAFRQTAQRARLALPKARGNGNGSPPPRLPAAAAGLHDSAGDVDPRLRLLQQLHSKAEELLDGVVMGRGTGNKPAPAFPPAALVKSRGRRERSPRPRPRRYADPEFRRRAEPGIGSIEFHALDARYMLVSIDGAPKFPVPIDLARLLAVLAFTKEDSADGFAPFQSRQVVAVRLAERTKRSHQDHAIIMAIGRLRDLLHRKGPVNPLLVETDGQNVRLRLRRDGAE